MTGEVVQVKWFYRMKSFFSKMAIGIAMPFAVGASLFSTKINQNNAVQIQKLDRPYVVEVIDPHGQNAGEYKGLSSETDPFLICQKLGATPFIEDKYNAFPDIDMGMGSKITLYRAPDYVIHDGKKNIPVRSWSKTVGELLMEQKIPEIGLDDRINFAPDTTLETGMVITIIRVAKTIVIEPQAIPFSIKKNNDPNLEKGNVKITQAGQNGVLNLFYLSTREDGVQISKVLQKQEVATAPVNQIETVGTKVVVYGTGKATWYINSSSMIGASNILPKGTQVNVVNVTNGKSVVVTISGGGDMSGIIDLSTAAFQALGATLGQGIIGNVRIEKYYP